MVGGDRTLSGDRKLVENSCCGVGRVHYWQDLWYQIHRLPMTQNTNVNRWPIGGWSDAVWWQKTRREFVLWCRYGALVSHFICILFNLYPIALVSYFIGILFHWYLIPLVSYHIDILFHWYLISLVRYSIGLSFHLYLLPLVF